MSDVETIQSIAEEIAVGFETLLKYLNQEREEKGLSRPQLEKTIDQSQQDTCSSSLSAWQDLRVKQDQITSPEIDHAKAAVTRLRSLSSKMADAQYPQSQPQPQPQPQPHAQSQTHPAPRKCPVPHTSAKCPVKHAKPKFSSMEQDFTTQGRPSDLSCPFASGPNTAADPIAAEFHPDSLSAMSLEAARACGRCPIRFLDKHSPEEIAEYFEKHKHELPRSHEICVKRYQANETSIRQLDEKYGNIVSMIQGLGNKHKAYLPGQNEDSEMVVEKWAEKVDKSDIQPVQEAEQFVDDEQDDHRSSRFDRPLREIRVGESPSRPWGIHVPAIAPVVQEQPQPAQESAPSIEKETPKTSKPSKPSVHAEQVQGHQGQQPVQFIFNGPVFFGYSSEEASKLMAEWMKMGQTS